MGFFAGAYIYASNANKHHSLWSNGVNTHSWSKSGKDMNGDTVCAVRLKQGAKDFVWNNHKFVRVPVQGKMVSSNIRKACAAKNLLPVCDHNSYFDGQCVLVEGAGAWHFSHPSHVAGQDGLDQSKLLGAYFYAGSSNGQWSLQNLGNTHAWSNARDKDGDTYCTKARTGETYDWNGYSFQRVAVKGEMSSANIRDACERASTEKRHLQPLCDHSTYADGICLVAGSNWHFSHPKNTKSNRVNSLFFAGAYIYASNANKHHSLWSNGVNTHSWSKSGKDMNGDAICAASIKPGSRDFTFNNHKFVRTEVEGKMTSSNIRRACAKKSMVPVCDHPTYFDGQCVIVGGVWHFSPPSHVAGQDDLDQKKLLGAYFYAGAGNGQWSLENIGNTHA